MKTDFIEKATFSEVYHFLRNKPDNDIFQCFKSLFGVALLFFPALVSKELIGSVVVSKIADLATGATLAGAGFGTIVGNAAKAAFGLFKNKKYVDYETRYEYMQIAQVMLVYAAYFDTISIYLPDENEEIALSPEMKRKISHDGFQEYIKKNKESAQQKSGIPDLLDREIALPTPTQDFLLYINNLENYYNELNNEFIKFFESISFWEEIDREENDTDRAQKEYFITLLKKLPKNAVNTYNKQYFELSREFPDFAIWANQIEHAIHKQQIDIGFKDMAEQLQKLGRIIKSTQNKAQATLEHYHTRYTDRINETIIKFEQGYFDEDIVFPSKKDIFIPQAFQALIYQKPVQLIQNDTWNNAYEGEEIGSYIRSILCHPTYGESPMLILGLPGAGKTLLCNMLAAQILSAEYYVIIINLRDANADDTIMKQIDDQIRNDLGDNCGWNDLREASLDKPIVLIFDGYDELLQASGKTYSNYLSKVEEFQKQQRSIYHIFVRCIITSRLTLIDKASIPLNCHILRLCDFDSMRIKIWCDIWNDANRHYFIAHNLRELEIAPTGKVNELARQPLLLLMLAIYDINSNCLQQQSEIGRAELYYNLIQEFIEREKKKDSSFNQGTKNNQKKAIKDGFRSLGIVALGMYNRKQLYIRTVDLNKDIAFLAHGGISADDTDENILEEADKYVASFFFVYSSEASVQANGLRSQATAYEFLHNTFGEFLTAHFILDLMFQLIKRQIADTDQDEVSSWTDRLKKEWHASLAYEPLFKRPVVLNMIHELSDIIAKEKEIETEDVKKALDNLFQEEIKNIINGNIFSELNKTLSMQGNPFKHPELMVHVAIYSINLILLRMIVCSESFNFTETLGTDTDWQKLTYIWRYAFSEEDLAGLSYLVRLSHTKKGFQLVYNFDEKAANRVDSLSKIDRLCCISNVLGDEAAYAIFSVFNIPINQKIQGILEREGIEIKTMYALKALIRYLKTAKIVEKDLILLLNKLFHCCKEEQDIFGLYVFCAILHSLAEMDLLNVEYYLCDQNFFDVLDYILRNVENNKCFFLCIIFQEIVQCVYKIHKKMKATFLCRCIQFYKNKIRNELYNLQRYDINCNYVVCMFTSLGKAVQSSINKFNMKDLGGCFYSSLKEISDIYRIFSWKEMTTVMQVCYTLRNNGDKELGNEIFVYSVYQIKVKNPYMFSESCSAFCLNSLIQCYYYSVEDHRSKGKSNYDQNLFDQYNELSEFAEKLLPSYEQAFYYLICLLCDDKFLSWKYGEHLPSELCQIIRQYGNQLSNRTLMKIRQYGEKNHNQGIKLAVDGVVSRNSKKMIPEKG